MAVYMVKRSDEEIDEQLNIAMEQFDKGGSKFPGMTYEQGVAEALQWVLGDSDDQPIPDE